MTYEEIFSKTKELILSNEITDIDADRHIAVQINIAGEGEGAFYIELKDGKAYIEPYEYYDRDCIFRISGEDFLKICSGSLNSVKAFTTGKLKIEGSIEKALEFSKIVDKVCAKNAEQSSEKSKPPKKSRK